MTKPTLRQCGNAANIPDVLWNSPYLRACRGAANEGLPVWLMRQAGRYMQEYRDVRAKAQGFLGLCHDPARAAQVTLDAQRILGVDAAIIFADILLILDTLGLPLSFAADHGPKLANPIRTATDVARLGDPRAAAQGCAYVAEACRITRAGLPADVPLIGFCGAPFTLASYAIEGGGSKQFTATRQFLYREPRAWQALCQHLVAALVPYLTSQIQAGCQAIQIFDSWAGILPEQDYRQWCLPHLRDLVQQLPPGIAVTLFAADAGHLLSSFADTGCDVVGMDPRVDLMAAWKHLGGPERLSVQGNLDPALLLAPRALWQARVDALLSSAGNTPGYIMNLGHGVLKETDPAEAIALVEQVHAWKVR